MVVMNIVVVDVVSSPVPTYPISVSVVGFVLSATLVATDGSVEVDAFHPELLTPWKEALLDVVFEVGCANDKV